MRRIAGIVLFCVGFGMGLMIVFPVRFYTIFLVVGLMLAGYHMACR